MVGIYREFFELNLVNTYLAIILTNSAFNLAFAIWILQGFFASIPVEIEEAAHLDGAGRFGTLWRIALPLTRPGLVTSVIFTFIAAWNEYVVALTLMQGRRQEATHGRNQFLRHRLRATLGRVVRGVPDRDRPGRHPVRADRAEYGGRPDRGFREVTGHGMGDPLNVIGSTSGVPRRTASGWRAIASRVRHSAAARTSCRPVRRRRRSSWSPWPNNSPWWPGRCTPSARGRPGAGSDQTTQRVHALLRNIFPGAAIDVVHDVELVLAAAGLRSGIGVIAGTGSVAWGRTQAGKQARAGGWGYVLGDGGSAFAVARAAIQHTLQLDDAGRPPDLLAQQVRAAIGVRTSVELIECFYQNPSPLHWAEHARLVFARADAEDRFAAEIVAGAASDLAAMVADVGRRLRSAGPVVMAGGLLTHQPLLREALGSRLAELGFTGLRLLDRAPVHRAVALAQRRAGATR